jgi:2-(1,2-epoxy-1,2-dihydrophenyl)acetyl-CoA isomerase
MPVVASRTDEIITIEMRWPNVRNALDATRAIELRTVLESASTDPRARAIILTGAENSFCSGGDLAFFAQLRTEPEEHLREVVSTIYQPLIGAIFDSPIPIVAVVDGPAIGLGFDLALACDRRFVGTSGWFMQGWWRVGLIPGAGGSLLLSAYLSPEQMWSFIVSQERLDADSAQHLGLATKCEGSGVESATAFLQEVIHAPRSTVTSYLLLMRSELQARLLAHLEQCSLLQAPLLASSEFQLRVDAILRERRPAS